MNSKPADDHAISKAVYILWIQKIISEIPFLQDSLRSASRFLRMSKAQSLKRIEEHVASTEPKDFMSVLLRAKNPSTGQSLATEELVSEAVLLLIAGDNIILLRIKNANL